MRRSLDSTDSKKVVLLVHGGGGHKEQAKRLAEGLIQKDGGIDFVELCETGFALNRFPYRECDEIRSKHGSIGAMAFLRNAMRCGLAAFRVFREFNVSIVVSTGPGISIVPSILARVAGKKVVHIETWSRFYSKSFTGRFMYYIANTFYIQNKELSSIYPKATYSGRL